MTRSLDLVEQSLTLHSDYLLRTFAILCEQSLQLIKDPLVRCETGRQLVEEDHSWPADIGHYRNTYT